MNNKTTSNNDYPKFCEKFILEVTEREFFNITGALSFVVKLSNNKEDIIELDRTREKITIQGLKQIKSAERKKQ